MQKLFPPYRHIVVYGNGQRHPVRIERETELNFHTPQGVFSKYGRRKCDDPNVRFEGPFTAEGDMECRP